jgi:hypothetical protein
MACGFTSIVAAGLLTPLEKLYSRHKKNCGIISVKGQIYLPACSIKQKRI